MVWKRKVGEVNWYAQKSDKKKDKAELQSSLYLVFESTRKALTSIKVDEETDILVYSNLVIFADLCTRYHHRSIGELITTISTSKYR
jgi:hypothetical protein